MHIRPLSQLTDIEVDDLARAAADRGEALDAENPYPAGTDQHTRFARAYRDRTRDLQPAFA